MSKKRRNEIAWKLIVLLSQNHGFPYLQPDAFQKNVREVAGELDLSVDEAMEFARKLVGSLTTSLFKNTEKEDPKSFRG